MATVYLLVTIAVAASAVEPSGDRDISPRIFNGSHSFFIPYQALLEIHRNNKWFQCGGSLISQFYVLTAAHCLEGATETTVTLGAYNQETIQQGIIQISKNFKFHNNFWTDSYGRPHNDIALIKLPQPVQLSNTINIVALPSRYNIGQKFIGKYAKTSGWGNTDSQNSHVSGDLKFAIMQVVENHHCDLVPDNDDSVLCAVGVNGISCSGDSAGPLVLDGVQIGIESFFGSNTDGSCLLKYPAAYTRITNYLEWIEANSDVIIK